MSNVQFSTEYVIYKILNRIHFNNGSVTWYQLDRMLRGNELNNYLKDLISILNRLEKDGLIIQKSNDEKPELLSLTDLGLTELNKLKTMYES